MEKQCNRCGWEPKADWLSKGLDFFDTLDRRTFYSCKSPLCKLRGVWFCNYCLAELEGKKPMRYYSPEKCPYCKIGVMHKHGEYR